MSSAAQDIIWIILPFVIVGAVLTAILVPTMRARRRRHAALALTLKEMFENLFNSYENFRQSFDTQAQGAKESLEKFNEFYSSFKHKEVEARQTVARFLTTKPVFLAEYSLKLNEMCTRLAALEQRLLEEAGLVSGLNKLW